jgi:hypothetical protein
MKFLLRFFIAFLAVTGAVALATVFFGVQFGRSNFWQFHGVGFLICIALFPRITLLLSGVPMGGLLWWLGWLFSPRLLVAFLATVTYWYQNPILVVAAWLVAFGGESSEKYTVVRQSREGWGSKRGYDSAKWVKSETKGRRKKR